MDQIPLRTILIESMDENSQNFSEYQIYLHEKVVNSYEDFIQQLLIELQDTEAPYNVIFLSVVLLDHCVQSSLIPVDAENKYLQTKLPLELIMKLFDIVFIYLLHPEISVRNTAVRLFSFLAMTQITQLSEIGIDNRIIEMLANAENYEALWSATQCIWSIIRQYKFNEEQQEIIIQNLFRILSIQDEDITLLQSPIRMLGKFSYLINRVFQDDAKFLDFIQQILKFSEHPELSEVVYQFADDTINQFPDILPFIIDTLISNSLNDFANSTSHDVLIALIVMWSSIFTLEIPISNEILQPLVEPLILTMQTATVSEVLDFREWEPYTAAFDCLQCFGFNFPEVVIPILLEYTSKASNSEDHSDREGALKCLHIVFHISPKDKLTSVIPTTLELLLELLNDDTPRVRYESVCTLTTVIKRINSSQPFQQFFPLLFKLLPDVEPTAKASFKAIQLISRFPDFEDFSDLYQFLTDSISSFPPNLIRHVVECFKLTPNSKILIDDALTSFQFLFNLTGELAQEISNGQQSSSTEILIDTIDIACFSLSTVISHCDDQILPFAADFLTLMCNLFTEFTVPNSLYAGSILCHPIPEFFQDQLQPFLPHVMEALQMYKQPSVIIPTLRLVSVLYEHVDLGDFLNPLFETMLDTLQRGESSNTKVAALNSFYSILCIKPQLFAPFVDKLHRSIVYIVSNLEEAYQFYFESTQLLVREVCKIQLKLLEILSKKDAKHVFISCIFLIIAVSKNQALIKLNSEDIYELICGMFEAMTEETKLAIKKVPEVALFLRTGLKQIQKSDNEIDEWLSILADSGEN